MAVCLTCGDKGFSSLLINCVQCQASVHRYCVIGPPIFDEEPKWSCEFCVSASAVPPPPCRSEHKKSIVDRGSLRKRALGKSKRNVSPVEVGEPNCVGKAVNKTGSKVANLDQETKSDSAYRKQKKLKENGSPLPGHEVKALSTAKKNLSSSQNEEKCAYTCDDVHDNTNKMPEVGSGPEQLKCWIGSRKRSSKIGLPRLKKTKVLNSDIGVEVGNPENFKLTRKKSKDVNPNDMSEDKQVKLKENSDPLLPKENSIYHHTMSIFGERDNGGFDSDNQPRYEESSSEIHSELSEGVNRIQNLLQSVKQPVSSVDGASTDRQLKMEKYVIPALSGEGDNINLNRSNVGEKSREGVELDICHKHDESLDDNISELSVRAHRIENSKQSNHADNKVSGVEETVADSDQQVDNQSFCDNSNYRAPRKKRRFIIEMEFSDEEPVLVVANRPQLVADDVLKSGPRLSPITADNHVLTQEPHKMFENHVLAQPFSSQGSLLKSGPRLSPVKADNHVLTREPHNLFVNHVLAQPFPVKLDSHVPARPLHDTVWRGSCHITGRFYFALEAHLSSKAHEKVHNAATVLPSSLHFEIVPKHHAWPKSFEKSPPNSESIGLYFFPVDDRAEKLYVNLVEEMIEHSLALKFYINTLELLVFCSRDLPREEWGINRKYYLWGAFKSRKEKEMTSSPCLVEFSDDRLPLATEISSDAVNNRNNLETTGAISSSVGGLSDLNWSKRQQVLNGNSEFISCRIKSHEIPKQICDYRALERCEADVGLSYLAKKRECYDRVLGYRSSDEFSDHLNKQDHYNIDPKTRRNGAFSYRANGWERDNRERNSRGDADAKERNRYSRENTRERESWERPSKRWKSQYKP